MATDNSIKIHQYQDGSKAVLVEFGKGKIGILVECYLKSEADKVIAELKLDIQDLQDDRKSSVKLIDEKNATIAQLEENKLLYDELMRYKQLASKYRCLNAKEFERLLRQLCTVKETDK